MDCYKVVCPKCGSTDVRVSVPQVSAPMMVGHQCRKCGNSGVFPEMKESEIEKFRKEINARKLKFKHK